MSETDSKRLTDEELDLLRDAGFAPEFLTVVRRDPRAVGQQRNSAREAARRLVRSDTAPDPSGFDRASAYGGDYFQKLARGDMAGAFYRADIANTRIMLDIFGRDYLVERLISDDNRPPESAARYVDERIEEYGDGILL